MKGKGIGERGIGERGIKVSLSHNTHAETNPHFHIYRRNTTTN